LDHRHRPLETGVVLFLALTGWSQLSMKRHRLLEPATYDFEELSIWRTKLPNAKHAVLPPQNNRPNPLVNGSVIYASVFSEGAVCALDRKSGTLLWRKEIPRLGGAAVYLAEGKLFAKTPHTLYALEPKAGNTVWSFCPYGESGESIYSHPTVYRGKLFIGDRSGFLHCLDSRTGQTLWRVRTNTAKNCDLNSTPLVVGRLVIVTTNANMAAAYDVKTGNRVWRRAMDGPSTFGPLLFRDMLVAIANSIYFLLPKDGKVVRRFSWKNDRVNEADCTQRGVVCMLQGRRIYALTGDGYVYALRHPEA
jgi:outer membrane protein assembly factor BamB